MKLINHPESDVNTGAYSPALICDGWLYISGQGPLDMKTGRIISESIEQETLRTLRNVEALLKAAGCTRHDVVKCTCYLQDIAAFEAFDCAYNEFFHDQILPARTTVGAQLPSIKIEVDAIARVS